jgi:hypothetical protein
MLYGIFLIVLSAAIMAGLIWENLKGLRGKAYIKRESERKTKKKL